MKKFAIYRKIKFIYCGFEGFFYSHAMGIIKCEWGGMFHIIQTRFEMLLMTQTDTQHSLKLIGHFNKILYSYIFLVD